VGSPAEDGFVVGVTAEGLAVVAVVAGWVGAAPGAPGPVVDELGAGLLVVAAGSGPGAGAGRVVGEATAAGGPADRPAAVTSPVRPAAEDDESGIPTQTAAEAAASRTGPARLPVGRDTAHRKSGTGQTKTQTTIWTQRGRARKRSQRQVTMKKIGCFAPVVEATRRRRSGGGPCASPPVAERLLGSVEMVRHAGEGGWQIAGADGLGQGGVLVEDAVDAVGIPLQGGDPHAQLTIPQGGVEVDEDLVPGGGHYQTVEVAIGLGEGFR
jgi:hypothetical protein